MFSGRLLLLPVAIAAMIPCTPRVFGQLCDPRPVRVLNFTQSPRSSSPQALGVVDGRAVFSAETPDTGRELWSTDGSPAGAVRIADTTSGTANPAFTTMASTPRGLFIRVTPPAAAGAELWVTLGTAATTQRLIPTTNIAGVSGAIIAAADRGDGAIALLIARAQTTELWCSDGTAPGTQLLRTFDCCAPDFTHDHFERIGARLFFSAGDAATGKEIWSTDALPGGTTTMHTQVFPEPEGLGATWMRAIGDRLYFSGVRTIAAPATEPFAWRAPAGAYLLGTLNASSATGSVPTHFFPVGGGSSGAPARVVFWADDGTHGRELWATSGASFDAALVVDLAPGIDSGAPPTLDQTGNAAVVGDRVVFVGFTPATGYELFVTDGTAPGTTLLRELAPGTSGGVPGLGITRISNALVYVDSTTVAEPVVTDGTDVGTLPLSALVPGPVLGTRRFAGVANERLYISTSTALYRSNGTPSGTELLATITASSGGGGWGTSGPQWQNLGNFIEIDPGLPTERIIFSALDSSAVGGHGQELWVVEVATHTATLLADLHTSDSSSLITGFAPVSGAPGAVPAAAFTARLAPNSSTFSLWSVQEDAAAKINLLSLPTTVFQSSVLRSFPLGAGTVVAASTITSAGITYYRTDGTPGGTWPIINVPQIASAAGPGATTSIDARAGSVIVMSGYSQAFGQELWASPGSPGDGGQLLDIASGPFSSNPTALTSLGNQVFFFANHPSFGYEPWITDGTVAGTFRLRDIFPGGGSSQNVDGQSSGVQVAVLNGRVYFGATEGPTNRVWSSDGTTVGTTPLTITGTTFTFAPRRFVATSSLVFFDGTTASTGTELYCTDGTTAGTRFLGDLMPGGTVVPFRELIAARDRVFFVPQVSPQGAELFTSDGTVAGTGIVRDIVPGGGGSTPTNLTCIGNTCYFTLLTPGGIAQGSELWRSDGTAAGTCIVADINPAGSSNPQYLRAVGSRLYFTASSPQHGLEPWVLNTCPADFDNSGTLSVQDIFDYLGSWFAGSPRADFDGVSGLAPADIFAFLAAWFAGCPG